MSYAASVPYWPYVDLLRRTLGIRIEDVPGEAAQCLTATLMEAGLPDAVPYLVRLLGIPESDVEDGSDDLTPETFRRGLHRSFVAWVRALARDAPVLIAIEDVHWADASTVELTQEVARLGRDEPVGLLLSGRPEAESAFAAVTGAAEGVARRALDLGPLDEVAIRRLIEHLLGGPAPGSLVAAVAERTGGNPLSVPRRRSDPCSTPGPCVATAAGGSERAGMRRPFPRRSKECCRLASIFCRPLPPASCRRRR